MPRRRYGRSSWSPCRKSAESAAREGRGVEACPYRPTSGWSTHWIRTFERQRQMELFS